MKKMALMVLLAVGLGGCGVNQKFVDSMDRAADLLLPDFEKILNADPAKKISEVLPYTTDPDKRKRRLRLIKEWRANIESAKEARLPFRDRLGTRTVRYDEGFLDRVK